MAKFIMTMGEKTLQLLAAEAEKRNVSVQEFLRAVVVPEWVRSSSLDPSVMQPARREIDSQMKRPSEYDPRHEPVLMPSIEQSKRQLANYLWSSAAKDD